MDVEEYTRCKLHEQWAVEHGWEPPQQSNVVFQAGLEQGRRDVVGWIDENKNNPQGSTINPYYTLFLGYNWQAKLREWGIK
jgi:spore cortex formation protein SpoVR/YcgB (stage V sporulation)